MGIAKKVLSKAKKNNRVVTRLMVENGKSFPTIMRWFKGNSEMLTTATSLSIICEELGIEQSEALTK